MSRDVGSAIRMVLWLVSVTISTTATSALLARANRYAFWPALFLLLRILTMLIAPVCLLFLPIVILNKPRPKSLVFGAMATGPAIASAIRIFSTFCQRLSWQGSEFGFGLIQCGILASFLGLSSSLIYLGLLGLAQAAKASTSANT